MCNRYGVLLSKDKAASWELIYEQEVGAFFDLIVVDGMLYGGTRR